MCVGRLELPCPIRSYSYSGQVVLTVSKEIGIQFPIPSMLALSTLPYTNSGIHTFFIELFRVKRQNRVMTCHHKESLLTYPNLPRYLLNPYVSITLVICCQIINNFQSIRVSMTLTCYFCL